MKMKVRCKYEQTFVPPHRCTGRGLADREGVDMANRTCGIDECDNPHLAKDLCQKHYGRKRRTGMTDVDRVWGDPETALWSKVDVGDCWEFTGGLRGGYGLVWDGTQMRSAHRMSWELLVGEIAKGLTIDHLCRNTVCVNPDHLEPVTAAENTRRAYGVNYLNRIKTSCDNGHEFTEENTATQAGTNRRCRQCQRDWEHKNRDQRNARRRKARAAAR